MKSADSGWIQKTLYLVLKKTCFMAVEKGLELRAYTALTEETS